MSKPKSYQQILRFKTKSKSIDNAPLPNKGGLVLTPEFVAEQKRLKQEMLYFVNKLRCPICKSQLDGEVNGKRAGLYCCDDSKEYTAEYSENKTLKYCSFRICYEQLSYLIVCNLMQNSLYDVRIFEIDLSLTLIYQDKYRKLLFSYTGPVPILDFPISEKDLLSDLRLLAVFS